ncbi:sterol desaturase family protein [Leptospira selangorensis]|uniref:Sterol desaturase family protein n=1 Tax=Leptospira selangorensis TaxID=2484982 RepID=A0A5F2C535_9LEPT|nr:sterol desaturase family protein [Leptospira selangorensis]TGM10814.1 sterol desaturase family protein [Leptospira selangorensis]TGM26849.1 sterol desaturase family protein [Leptospira selangorensis]
MCFHKQLFQYMMDLVPQIPIIFLIDFIRYFLFAGIAFLVFYIWKHPFQYRKIQEKNAKPSQFRKEFLYSVSSVIVYTSVTLIVFLFRKYGYFKFYERIEDYGWGYLILSTVLILGIQDFYFYWTHRLMHTRFFYKRVHKLHHDSTTPSPWTAYSFSPWEALIHSLIMPIVALLFPVHPLALMIFMTFQIIRNVLGHSGYEIFPSWMGTNKILKLLNSNTNHDMHHQSFRYNYGLYTTIWDYLFGTVHPEYEKTFAEITSKKPEQKRKELQESI